MSAIHPKREGPPPQRSTATVSSSSLPPKRPLPASASSALGMGIDNAPATFKKGEDCLRAADYEQALIHYLSIIRTVPAHWRTRFRIADTLMNLNAAAQALEIYKSLAWQAIKSGHPLSGLVAIKMAAAMDSAQADLVHVVAELYGRDSTQVSFNTMAAPRRELRPSDTVASDVHFLKGAALIDAAAKEAAHTELTEVFPVKLPAIPLFSYLEEDAFAEVLLGMQLRRYVTGHALITEGEIGNSFFMLAHGNVSVSRSLNGRTVPLARLHHGAVFGEMALIKAAPRTATVRALDDCDLLELSRDFLEQETQKIGSVTKALHDFTHQRFLANLAATCAIFKPFPPSVRSDIIKKFEQRETKPGDLLIKEGAEGAGLFLVVKGEIEILKLDDSGNQISLAVIKEGSVFGEMSLLKSQPTSASCMAKTPGEVLFLPRNVFNSTLVRHPELKEGLSKITGERIQQNKDILNPEYEDFMLLEDDDLIML